MCWRKEACMPGRSMIDSGTPMARNTASAPPGTLAAARSKPDHAMPSVSGLSGKDGIGSRLSACWRKLSNKWRIGSSAKTPSMADDCRRSPRPESRDVDGGRIFEAFSDGMRAVTRATRCRQGNSLRAPGHDPGHATSIGREASMNRQDQIGLLRRLLHYVESGTTCLADAPWQSDVSVYVDPAHLAREERVLFRRHPILM